jgi:alpha-1,2-mannosyltransferase
MGAARRDEAVRDDALTARGRAAEPGARTAASSVMARRLLLAGGAAFTAALGLYVGYVATSHSPGHFMSPVDLRVYRIGGQIVRGLTRFNRPGVSAPLYHWPGRQLQFTYPPFAALLFTVLTLVPFGLLTRLSVAVNIAAMLATVWVTFGALGYRRGKARLGATLLVGAALLLTEPVQRTMYLGQVELVLLALIMWDQCQPDRRWWKGAGIGLAAGIKLVPLIFIPYLLLTRRFRQAAVAAGVFAATAAVGFAVLPGDSARWWLDGLFLRGTRTGFVGWEGNQSLFALITRLVGSVASAQPAWLAVAAVTAAAGLAGAALLDRAGHRLAGLLTCALTGLLISPISWDHHWVWIVPGVTVLVHYAARARSVLRYALAALAAAVTVAFGAWPGSLWGAPRDLGGFSEGFIWAPPNTNPGVYFKHGDRPRYAEYHWHGAQLIVGNLYVLTGAALLVLLLALAVRAARQPAGSPGPAPARAAPPPGSPARPGTEPGWQI